MSKIKLLLSYDGTDYQGWQKQPELVTIQGTLEQVLSRLYNEPIRTFGSGRTDAGTHAVGQVAHFESSKPFNNESSLVRAMNSLLPETVVVKQAWHAPEEFHALHSAVQKTYVYRVWNHPVRSALWPRRALWVPHPLDLTRLNELSGVLHGRHDFKSFQSAGTVLKTTVRQISRCEWRAVRPHLLEMRITGSGFLKQMVRNLLGTLLYLEKHKLGPAALINILDARDRQAAKGTAPAHGLYLYRVDYPVALDNKCRKL